MQARASVQCTGNLPETERGLSDTSSSQKNFAGPTGGAAPAAFLHHPRHHGDGRLCVAQGREMAGGAARSLDPGPGYPEISRSRERLHREPARPHRAVAEEAGRGNARADQGRRFQRALAGRPVRLFAEIPRGRPARIVRPHAARRRRGQYRARRRRACGRATNISGSAARGIRPITGCMPGAPTPKARNIFPFACATGPPAPTSTISSRRPTAAWSGAWTAKASSTSSSTTITARCRSGAIAWGPGRRTTFSFMKNRIPAGSPICMRAPAAASA